MREQPRNQPQPLVNREGSGFRNAKTRSGVQHPNKVAENRVRDPETAGHLQPSPWKLGGLTGRQLARNTWHEILADNLLGRAAQLAYFFLFAIFPLVIFLTALLGIFTGPDSRLVHHLISYMTRAMPTAAGTLVRDTVQHSLSSSGDAKLAFGILVALFSASSGMAALIDALNTVFGVREGRSIVKKRFTALWLTVVVGILVCIAIFLVAAGSKVAGAVSSGVVYWLWQIAEYAVAFAFLLISFSLVYRFAPDIDKARWRVFTPGAVAGLCIWIIVSFGLREYLQDFHNYTSAYGSMGAVMALMLWFYLTGLAFLIGGEIDAIIGRAATGRVKHRWTAENTSGAEQNASQRAA